MSKRKIKYKKPASRMLPSYSQLCAELGYEEGEGPLVETYALDAGVDRSQFNSQEELVKYLVAQEEKKKKR